VHLALAPARIVEATWITARNFARPSVTIVLFASIYENIDVNLPPVTRIVLFTLVPGAEYGTHVAPLFPDSCTPVNPGPLNPITITAISYFFSFVVIMLIVRHNSAHLLLDTVNLKVTSPIFNYTIPLINCQKSNCLPIDTIIRTCHAALSSTVTLFDYPTVLTNAGHITLTARTYLLSVFIMSSNPVNPITFFPLTCLIELVDTSHVPITLFTLFRVDNTPTVHSSHWFNP
jgi:hypothetical protein